jgi:hypothetical protein
VVRTKRRRSFVWHLANHSARESRGLYDQPSGNNDWSGPRAQRCRRKFSPVCHARTSIGASMGQTARRLQGGLPHRGAKRARQRQGIKGTRLATRLASRGETGRQVRHLGMLGYAIMHARRGHGLAPVPATAGAPRLRSGGRRSPRTVPLAATTWSAGSIGLSGSSYADVRADCGTMARKTGVMRRRATNRAVLRPTPMGPQRKS